MSPIGTRATLLLLACALCAGCPPDPAECEPGGDPPTLEIGWGESTFEPIRGADPAVPLVMGPQGGYHNYIALQATDLDASQLIVASMQGTIDGVVLSDVEPWITMKCDQDAKALVATGALLIWDSVPEDLDGKTADVEVTLRDIDGTSVSASTSYRIDAADLLR